jgi:hypothetical protein
MKTYHKFGFLVIFLALVHGSFFRLTGQGNAFTMMPGLGPFPGYVILTGGDTVRGKVKWVMKYIENNPCQLKFTAENGASKTFGATDIKGCGITMNEGPDPVNVAPENYVTMPSFKKGEPVFLRRLMSGKVTVYQNRSATVSGSSVSEETSKIEGIGFIFTIEDGLYIGPTYHTEYKVIKERSHASSYYVVRDGQAMIKVEKEDYDSMIKTLFGDCPALDQELTKNPDLKKFKNFMLLAEVYNQICK